MVVVLFLVVLHFLLEILVQHALVKVIIRTINKHDVLQLSRTGGTSVDPLAVDKEELPIKDGNLPFDRRPLEGMARSTITMDKMLLE